MVRMGQVPPAGVYWRISMKIGMVSIAPRSRSAIITGLRPIRSESAPKTMKKGGQRQGDIAMIQFESTNETLALAAFCSQERA
ncbi:MAG: hypothetical protein U0232_06385 [Thermomicrobiales bacterium]